MIGMAWSGCSSLYHITLSSVPCGSVRLSARCLHPSPGRFGDNIISSGNSHGTAWKTRKARGFRQNLQNLQRSQVRLQDASSRSQTFIWWFWSIKICETKLNAPKTSSDVWSVWFRLISFDSQDLFEPASVFPSFHAPRSVVRNFLGAHLETSAQGQWHGWRKNGGAISEEIAGRSCMTWTWKRFASRCTIRARCH